MRHLLYSGSFDPVTYGHLDIMRRAAKLCDELYVGVGINHTKNPWFTVEERMELIRQNTKDIDNLFVMDIPGLTVERAKELAADLVRGIRDINDLAEEQRIYNVNRELAYGVETVYLLAEDMPFVSSSLLKSLALMDASSFDLTKFAPAGVVGALRAKAQEMRSKGLLSHDKG